jgi:alpha-amylase/alpha-mannosidase (GH57 family)
MTRVAFVWHMHQPFYVDGSTGVHVLPWVRLHALKDYWGMVAVAREFPDLRLTFNLVPSLLEQVEAFARGEARDPHLELGLRPAEELTPDEAAFCVNEFFHAQYERMIAPHARYAELHARRREMRAGGTDFTTDELRDLQVWHKLVWVDPLYADDSRVMALMQRGRGFTEADKRVLREVELEILGRVIPEYQRAGASGHIELSTSPYYHPILPLLCDLSVYRTTHPEWPAPEERFAYPSDAAEQMRRAIALHTRLFGSRPAGVWPSEGSVSDAVVEVLAEAGMSWMATDEDILGLSLGLTFQRDSNGVVHNAEALYRPYLVGRAGHTIACVFRDHTLSDLIGFTYSAWPAEAAAQDFVRRIDAAGLAATAQGLAEPTVFVILDGENAWEHFEGQGRPFLRALYHALTTHPEIRTVTVREACAAASAHLPHIRAGSWINSDFYIWAGHADDRRAWAQVARARRRLEAAPPSHPGLARAWDALLIAEGSDWFWWYGDDHSSDHDAAFDELFRCHLRNLYLALGEAPPHDLWGSNISTSPTVTPSAPWGPLTPTIDGEDSSYFEWLGAGWFETRAASGAMHQVAAGSKVRGFRYGYGDGALWLSVVVDDDSALAAGGHLTVSFPDTPGPVAVSLAPDGRLSGSAARGIVGRTAEFQIPLAIIGAGSAAKIPIVIAHATALTGTPSQWRVDLHGPMAVVQRPWRA